MSPWSVRGGLLLVNSNGLIIWYLDLALIEFSTIDLIFDFPTRILIKNTDVVKRTLNLTICFLRLAERF